MQVEEPYQLPPQFRQQPLTARVLEDYAQCPRKFLLSFFVGRAEDRHFRGGPAALHQAVRQALVDCYNLGGPAETDAQVLLDAFEAYWQGELCADSMEEEQLHEQGLQMLRDYHEDQRGRPVEVLGTDRQFEGSIAGQAFRAVADVILHPTGSAMEMVRFVTSRRPDSAEKLKQDLSAQLLWLLAHEHLPSPLRILYYSLRKRRAEEVILSDGEASAARDDLAARAARLYGESDFAPIKGQYCRWCRVRHRCPLWQR